MQLPKELQQEHAFLLEAFSQLEDDAEPDPAFIIRATDFLIALIDHIQHLHTDLDKWVEFMEQFLCSFYYEGNRSFVRLGEVDLLSLVDETLETDSEEAADREHFIRLRERLVHARKLLEAMHD
jgi:hypothetical protein